VKEAANKAEQAPEEKPKAELKPEEKPKAETPKEAAPKPEAKTAEEKKEKPAKPKEAAAAPPKKPKPKPPATAKKRDFNTDRIAALLNKIPDAANEPSPVLPSEETPSKKVRGQSNGTQMTMSVNEIDALRSRIAQCWSPPPGGLGAEEIVVKLRLKLNEDGTLVGYPTVANSGSSPFFQAAADSAVRAVYQCQPYALPSDKYALWRDMILNFDPSEMYRAG
jgi:colicin import membrane protein